MIGEALLRATVQGDVLEAYDAAANALRVAEKHAPDLAPKIREAVDSLFAVRVALDEGRA